MSKFKSYLSENNDMTSAWRTYSKMTVGDFLKTKASQINKYKKELKGAKGFWKKLDSVCDTIMSKEFRQKRLLPSKKGTFLGNVDDVFSLFVIDTILGYTTMMVLVNTIPESVSDYWGDAGQVIILIVTVVVVAELVDRVKRL